MTQAFFIASTGQHVGKTTTSLGLLSGLHDHFPTVGFFKPIGQESTKITSGEQVDKDVLLIKTHFSLQDQATNMSPVLFPKGFTRDYLDGKIDRNALEKQILSSFSSLCKKHPCIVVEGTGHVGVGSIVHLSNAKVASLLQIPMILIASGGLGSSFDALSLNKTLCDLCKVRVSGIILNRVIPEKQEMVLSYMKKALDRWNIPILGSIPFSPSLSSPSMNDFEILFGCPLITGQNLHFRHFAHTRLVDTSVKNFREHIVQNQLVITPSMREEILLAILSKHIEKKRLGNRLGTEPGVIATGETPPRQIVVEKFQKEQIPMIYVPLSSYEAMKMITSYTVKIRAGDTKKIHQAIALAASHIDFAQLLLATKTST